MIASTKIATRIEIGSGKMPHPGFTTIDIEPSSGADIIADFRTLHFENLEEIIAYHLLEHFSREEGIRVLKLWHSWLKLGGTILVETPDFEGICEHFFDKTYYADKAHLVQHAYGSQEADWAFHRDGWYREKFDKLLPELGFRIILIKRKHSYIRYGESRTRHRLPNILVIAEKI